MQSTITLKKVSVGTEVNIVQEGIPDVIPLEACYLGWQESLDAARPAGRGRDQGVARRHDRASVRGRKLPATWPLIQSPSKRR